MNTYRKLKDGSWGVAVHIALNVIAGQSPKAGDVVTVTLRDGRTKQETLGECVGEYEGTVIYRAVPKQREPRKIADVGNLAGVMALFNKAKQHLKFPAIVLSVPEINETIRINVAGDRAKVPGSLNVVNKERVDAQDRKVWYGRVHQDGRFEQAHNDQVGAVANRLREFAADPAKVASEHGRLTGRCCFCHLPLKDERSTAVGYGSTCASHFGLPWGDRPAGFAEAA
jgi:hypothetical protein